MGRLPLFYDIVRGKKFLLTKAPGELWWLKNHQTRTTNLQLYVVGLLALAGANCVCVINTDTTKQKSRLTTAFFRSVFREQSFDTVVHFYTQQTTQTVSRERESLRKKVVYSRQDQAPFHAQNVDQASCWLAMHPMQEIDTNTFS